MKLLRAAALLAAAVPLMAVATPDCSLAPGWTQHGESRMFEGDNLYEYMNGNSEGYFIYGFVRMQGVTCKKGGDTIHVDVSEFGDAESAYGMFTANRDARLPSERIGAGAQIVPRKAIAAKGKYYLEIASEADKDNTAMLRELASALAGRVEGEAAIPAVLGWFPSDGLTPGTPRLVPQSVLGIGALKRGYVAHYENKSKAFLVREAGPEAAAGVFAKLRARFAETADAKIGDGGFTGTDKYLGRMAIFRKGPWVGGYVGVPEGQDTAALAAALTGKLQ